MLCVHAAPAADLLQQRRRCHPSHVLRHYQSTTCAAAIYVQQALLAAAATNSGCGGGSVGCCTALVLCTRLGAEQAATGGLSHEEEAKAGGQATGRACEGGFDKEQCI